MIKSKIEIAFLILLYFRVKYPILPRECQNTTNIMRSFQTMRILSFPISSRDVKANGQDWILTKPQGSHKRTTTHGVSCSHPYQSSKSPSIKLSRCICCLLVMMWDRVLVTSPVSMSHHTFLTHNSWQCVYHRCPTKQSNAYTSSDWLIANDCFSVSLPPFRGSPRGKSVSSNCAFRSAIRSSSSGKTLVLKQMSRFSATSLYIKQQSSSLVMYQNKMSLNRTEISQQ